MNGTRNSNPLLMEIMIAILFLALCSTAIMEVFGFVKNLNTGADTKTRAMVNVQNIGERVYVSDEPSVFLEAEGFTFDNGVWINDFDEYTIIVTINKEMTAAGWLMNAQINAVAEDEILAGIPCVRYFGEEVE